MASDYWFVLFTGRCGHCSACSGGILRLACGGGHRFSLRVNELKRLLERCERLHTVRLSRHIGSSYQMFLTSIFRHQYPNFDLSRVTITTLPFISVRPFQRQLTELGFSRTPAEA